MKLFLQAQLMMIQLKQIFMQGLPHKMCFLSQRKEKRALFALVFTNYFVSIKPNPIIWFYLHLLFWIFKDPNPSDSIF